MYIVFYGYIKGEYLKMINLIRMKCCGGDVLCGIDNYF